MKTYIINTLSHIRTCILLSIIVFSLGATSCDNSQKQGNTESNVGTAQDSLEIDTTANASRGGTQESTGRADADTSGTGKASTPDSIR
jgi:hypothetical protein